MIDSVATMHGKALRLFQSRPGIVCLLATLLACACTQAPVKNESPWLLRQATVNLSNGVDYYQQGEYERARKYFRSAIDTYQSFNHVQGLLKTHINLAKTELAIGNLGGAETNIKHARQLILPNDQDAMTQHIDILESSLLIEQKNPEKALLILEPYLPGSSTGNPPILDSIQIAALINRTRIAFLLADKQGYWIDELHSATANYKGDNALPVARLWRFRAQLSHLTGNYSARDKHYNDALIKYRAKAHRKGVAMTLTEWADANNEQQQWSLAAERYERAFIACLAMKDQSTSLRVLNGLTLSYQKLQQDNKLKNVSGWISKINQADNIRWWVIEKEFFRYRELNLGSE